MSLVEAFPYSIHYQQDKLPEKSHPQETKIPSQCNRNFIGMQFSFLAYEIRIACRSLFFFQEKMTITLPLGPFLFQGRGVEFFRSRSAFFPSSFSTG